MMGYCRANVSANVRDQTVGETIENFANVLMQLVKSFLIFELLGLLCFLDRRIDNYRGKDTVPFPSPAGKNSMPNTIGKLRPEASPVKYHADSFKIELSTKPVNI